MDQGGTYRCEATTEDGQDFVRFVSVHSIGAALPQIRAPCTIEGLNLLRVSLYCCDAKGNRVGKALVTWGKTR